VILQIPENHRLPVPFRKVQQRRIHQPQHRRIGGICGSALANLDRLVHGMDLLASSPTHAFPHRLGCHMMRNPV
jgi:hypothetical protein